MAASRKPPSADFSALAALRGKRVAVGLSGGLDSVALLRLLRDQAPRYGIRLSALHVNHGLSPNAGAWENFCQALCLEWGVPFKALKVSVRRQAHGLEAAAREARLAAFGKARADALALAHHLDDQAETVLFNLLRGTGLAGASGMAVVGRLGRKRLLRPLLGVPRSAIRAYAARERLAWIEDESNADESLTRNFLRHRVGPLLETRFPRWRESLARAARHFAAEALDARGLLRAYLKGKGLRAPSEAKLVEMLRQLGAGRGAIAHDGKTLRIYKERIFVESSGKEHRRFEPRLWQGETKLALAGGELHFRRVRGEGIDPRLVKRGGFEVRLRSGGERLQPDPARPRRTLKNLFQEAGIPPWERERLPMLYCGEELVWVPGIGVDAKYASRGRRAGLLPEWRA
jgi:tRNA(Ile)-lysidine synthase